MLLHRSTHAKMDTHALLRLPFIWSRTAERLEISLVGSSSGLLGEDRGERRKEEVKEEEEYFLVAAYNTVAVRVLWRSREWDV